MLVYFWTLAEIFCLYKPMDTDSANMSNNYTEFAIQHGLSLRHCLASSTFLYTVLSLCCWCILILIISITC